MNGPSTFSERTEVCPFGDPNSCTSGQKYGALTQGLPSRLRIPESRIDGWLLYNANFFKAFGYRQPNLQQICQFVSFVIERLYNYIYTVHALHWREKSAKVKRDFAKSHSKKSATTKNSNLGNVRILSI